MELVVELPSSGHRVSRLPCASVRIDGVVEDLRALIGDRIRPCGATKQRQTKDVADGVVAILGAVEQAQAVGAVAFVSPAQGGDFEACLLEAVVASGRALDRAVGNFIGCRFVCGGERKGRLEEDVLFVPVEVIVDDEFVGVGVENQVLRRTSICARCA